MKLVPTIHSDYFYIILQKKLWLTFFAIILHRHNTIILFHPSFTCFSFVVKPSSRDAQIALKWIESRNCKSTNDNYDVEDKRVSGVLSNELYCQNGARALVINSRISVHPWKYSTTSKLVSPTCIRKYTVRRTYISSHRDNIGKEDLRSPGSTLSYPLRSNPRTNDAKNSNYRLYPDICIGYCIICKYSVKNDLFNVF